MTEITAIEIRTPKIYEIIQALNPGHDLPYDEVHMHFLVIGFPGMAKTTIWSPSEIDETFDRIETGLRLTLNQLIKY